MRGSNMTCSVSSRPNDRCHDSGPLDRERVQSTTTQTMSYPTALFAVVVVIIQVTVPPCRFFALRPRDGDCRDPEPWRLTAPSPLSSLLMACRWVLGVVLPHTAIWRQ